MLLRTSGRCLKQNPSRYSVRVAAVAAAAAAVALKKKDCLMGKGKLAIVLIRPSSHLKGPLPVPFHLAAIAVDFLRLIPIPN